LAKKEETPEPEEKKQQRTAEETKRELGKALKNASETGSPSRWKGLTADDVTS
jgi:hypothetical protein